MDKLDEILRAYALAGIQAVGLVPSPLVESKKTALFVVVFRYAGELHSHMGTYPTHMLYTASLVK